MHAIKLVLLATLAACALPAAAQWQWVDSQGRKVFSDRAPPPDIPLKNILRQPGGVPSPAPVAPAAATPAAPSAASAEAGEAPVAAQDSKASAEVAGTDKALEEQKRKAEAQEAAKVKAEQARVAKQREDNCNRAKQAKAVLNSGQLLASTNAQGERGYMDDATRQAELKRADSVITSECGPAR